MREEGGVGVRWSGMDVGSGDLVAGEIFGFSRGLRWSLRGLMGDGWRKRNDNFFPGKSCVR